MNHKNLHFFSIVASIGLFLLCLGARATDLNPPLGTFPTHDFKLGMLFREHGDVVKIPNKIEYNENGKIKISPLPDKEVTVYIKVKQDIENVKEGGILLKYRRIYNSRVTRDRRKKVKIIIGNGYYNNGKKLVNKIEKIVKLQQYIDYSLGTKVDSLKQFLSISVDEAGQQMLYSNELYEYLEFLSDEAPNRSLLTAHFIHYKKAAGTRWHRIDIPIAQEKKENLEKVVLEAVLLTDGTISNIGEYIIEQK